MNINLRGSHGFILMFFSLMQLSSQPARAVGEFLCTDVTEIPQAECQALVALYNRTNGSGWMLQPELAGDHHPKRLVWRDRRIRVCHPIGS